MRSSASQCSLYAGHTPVPMPIYTTSEALWGALKSGEIAVGDAVTVLPNGYQSKVKAIQIGDMQLQSAQTEQKRDDIARR